MRHLANAERKGRQPESPAEESPQPSTSGAPPVEFAWNDSPEVPNSPQPSTSGAPPVEFVVNSDDDRTVPALGCEVEVASSSPIPSQRRRRSAIQTTDPGFDVQVTDWLDAMGSDSDNDFDPTADDPCNDFFTDPTLIPLQQAPTLYVNDLTEQQELVMDVEDRQNDDALRALIPTDHYTFDWDREKTTFTGKRETFTGTPGPTFDVTDDTTPTDIFERMIDVQFVDMLVAETNRYAAQKIAALTDANNLPTKSRLRRWTPTDRPEMMAYLSLTILMGLYPLPVEESYFSYNGFGTMPFISKIMSYNRYLLLKMMLHFTDNDAQTERTKLTKVKPVIDYFNDKFASLYGKFQKKVTEEMQI